MERVTAADVQEFAKAHWRTGDLRIVVAGDAPQLLDELRKAYPDLLVIPQADVDLDAPALVKASAGQR
jgi:zinc protease